MEFSLMARRRKVREWSGWADKTIGKVKAQNLHGKVPP
jgi:hypothetical protein